MVRTLNLGILAHVDAGKTSLTERLLFAAGVIDEIGSVDDGSTQTDSLALERQRGITIKSAVVSFVVNDVTVNLIDTPGHPDFIAEVERVLSVLDGAVLVISAVEGVQAQTRVLMRTLQRLRIPTLHLRQQDRPRAAPSTNACCESDRREADARRSSRWARRRDLGTRSAGFAPFGARAMPRSPPALADLLAEHDDAILAALRRRPRAPCRTARLRGALAEQSRQARRASRVLRVSDHRRRRRRDASPASRSCCRRRTAMLPRPVSGTIFKIERGPAGEKIAYVRMFSGTVRARDRVQLRRQPSAKVTAISVFDRGACVRRQAVSCGTDRRSSGDWPMSRIGDAIGDAAAEAAAAPLRPADAGDRDHAPPASGTGGRCTSRSTQLAEQDPLINLRQDDVRQEIYVSLYGEVQKEVIQATLADEYGIEVGFHETSDDLHRDGRSAPARPAKSSTPGRRRTSQETARP